MPAEQEDSRLEGERERELIGCIINSEQISAPNKENSVFLRHCCEAPRLTGEVTLLEGVGISAAPPRPTTPPFLAPDFLAPEQGVTPHGTWQRLEVALASVPLPPSDPQETGLLLTLTCLPGGFPVCVQPSWLWSLVSFRPHWCLFEEAVCALIP